MVGTNNSITRWTEEQIAVTVSQVVGKRMKKGGCKGLIMISTVTQILSSMGVISKTAAS